MVETPPCSWKCVQCNPKCMEMRSPKYQDVCLIRDLFILHVVALGSIREVFWDLCDPVALLPALNVGRHRVLLILWGYSQSELIQT